MEADGLKAMREAGARRPEVLAFGRNGDGKSFLLMTYVRPSRPRRDYWQNLGHMLAAMHRADTSAWTKGRRFGFYENNYSGSIRQKNRVHDSWVEFFRSQRLLPRLELTQQYFTPEDRRRARYLLRRVFLPMEQIRTGYPFFYRHRLLLPLLLRRQQEKAESQESDRFTTQMAVPLSERKAARIVFHRASGKISGRLLHTAVRFFL